MRVALVSLAFMAWHAAVAQRVNTISVFYPLYEEFSYNPAIDATLTPGFTDLHVTSMKQLGSNLLNRRFDPLTLGFSVVRQTKAASFWRASYHYYSATPGSRDRKPGQSMRIHQHLFAVDRQSKLWSSANQKIALNALVQGVFRLGKDTYWLNYIGWVDIFPYRTLRDFGLTVGLVGTVYPVSRIALSAECGYTRWLYLYSNFNERRLLSGGYYPLKPWNQLDMKVSLGFTFGKKQLQKLTAIE